MQVRGSSCGRAAALPWESLVSSYRPAGSPQRGLPPCAGDRFAIRHWPCARSARRRSILLPPILPLLALRGRRPVFALVISRGNLSPIRGQHSAARRLEGLVHGTTSLVVGSVVDLLEQRVQSLVACWLVVLQFLLYLFVDLAPIPLLLVRSGIR